MAQLAVKIAEKEGSAAPSGRRPTRSHPWGSVIGSPAHLLARVRCVALRAGARATAEAGNRRRHGVVRQPLSAALLLVSTLTGFVALAPSASAASPTCSFATAGSGTYASTLCWFDLSSYSAATATGASGQTMTMTIPGGYTLTFSRSAAAR
jgi:hypothetical protein